MVSQIVRKHTQICESRRKMTDLNPLKNSPLNDRRLSPLPAVQYPRRRFFSRNMLSCIQPSNTCRTRSYILDSLRTLNWTNLPSFFLGLLAQSMWNCSSIYEGNGALGILR